MRINPQNLSEEEKVEKEKTLQKRLALFLAFCSVFGFFFKILFF